jgi:hypothetical protein
LTVPRPRVFTASTTTLPPNVPQPPDLRLMVVTVPPPKLSKNVFPRMKRSLF